MRRMSKSKRKVLINILYWVSVGVWMTCGFITVRYGDSAPMWVALIVMNVFGALRIE